MNQTTYKPILSIQVFNTYFKNAIIRGLQFVQTSSLNAVLKQVGIFIHFIANGIQLFAAAEMSVAYLLAKIQNTQGITAFNFNITVLDPYFYNYTDVPLNRNVSLVFPVHSPRIKPKET